MKYYLLVLLVLLSGCKQIPDKKIYAYYSAPELEGIISFNNRLVQNSPVFLLTSCYDQQTVTNITGYFKFSEGCVELVPFENEDELGFFYQLIISFDDQNFLWRISDLGYGIKDISALIDLTTKTVIYRINDGKNPLYEKIDELTLLSDN